MIAIVDYGAGNLASVCKAFSAIGVEARLARSAVDLRAARGVVVPGVGHFGATAVLDATWRAEIMGHVRAGRPLLGICLGMQWLFEASDEAPGCPGLGLFPGRCARLAGEAEAGGARVKVPHVGWNALELTAQSSALAGLAGGAYVYFTHSYAAPAGPGCVAVTLHGNRFAAVVERETVWGAQFHPEKSGEAGLQVLRNFTALVREGSRA